MELTSDIALGCVFYGAIGYLGAWFFKGDGDLIERFGLLAAFFITYVVFFVVVFASAQVSDIQNWLITMSFATSFLYRFFIRHG